MSQEIKTKAGYAAIIGKPNAGKSTLMNALVGAKLSIVSPKPQTTRKRVLGIFSDEDMQIVFLDTPGIMNPKYEMQKSMMKYVNDSVEETELIIVLIDLTKYRDFNSYFEDKLIKQLSEIRKPKIFVLNKIDTKLDVKSVLPIIAEISAKGIADDIIPISATHQENLKNLTNAIKKYLPEAPFYYDPEMLSTQPQRFFVAEIIRERIFYQYSQEIPYSIEVQISEFKERENGKWYISADIIVERDNQKAIIIGAKGEKLKQIGSEARKQIEESLETGVFLELFVKVRENWRQNKNMLNSFGY